MAHHQIPNTISKLSGVNLPVYPCVTGYWAVKPNIGPSNKKIMICSIPKAGTHLFARLLSLLGLVSSDIFFNKDYINDNRFVDVKQARFHNMETRLWIPIEITSQFLENGQFGYGHLPCEDRVKSALDGFKVIFISREMRAATVSHMRYIGDSDWRPPQMENDINWRQDPLGPDKMRKYFREVADFMFNDRCHPMANWVDEENILKLSYEQIMGDYGHEIQLDTISKVSEFCEIEKDFSSVKIISELIGKSTITYSGKRTSWESCWDSDIEASFKEFGGEELNRKFGHDLKFNDISI